MIYKLSTHFIVRVIACRFVLGRDTQYWNKDRYPIFDPICRVMSVDYDSGTDIWYILLNQYHNENNPHGPNALTQSLLIKYSINQHSLWKCLLWASPKNSDWIFIFLHHKGLVQLHIQIWILENKISSKTDQLFWYLFDIDIAFYEYWCDHRHIMHP